MGFFKKKVCEICGKEAGLLSRQKIANDDYICSDCEAKCGRLIWGSTFKSMTREDVIRQMEETTNNVQVLATLFRETDCVAVGVFNKKILSVDATHGWIAVPNKDPKALFTFDQIGSVEVRYDTRRIPEPTPPAPAPGPAHGPVGHGPQGGPVGHGPVGHGPQGGPVGHGPVGHGPQAGPVGHHAMMRMMPPPPAGFPICPAGYEITGIDVRITIVNSWIKWFDLTIMDDSTPTDPEIVRGYNDAARVVELLNWCRNAQLTQNAVQAAVEQAAFVAQTAAQAAPAPAPAPGTAAFTPEAVAQIKQLKELLDIGAITPEEFDAKKRQLLGL